MMYKDGNIKNLTTIDIPDSFSYITS